MEALHNAARTVVEKITGESSVTEKDVANAAANIEHLQHKKVQQDIDAEIKIAKAAKKVADRQHEALVDHLDKSKDIDQAGEKYNAELRKKQLVDVTGTIQQNEAAVRTQQLQCDNVIFDNSNFVQKDVINAAEKQSDLRHQQFQKDIEAQKDILDAAKKLEKEAHKQQVKDLEAAKDVAAAARKLELEQQKKVERDLEAQAKINNAAEKAANLTAQQTQQRCTEALKTQGGEGDTKIFTTTRTVIH